MPFVNHYQLRLSTPGKERPGLAYVQLQATNP